MTSRLWMLGCLAGLASFSVDGDAKPDAEPDVAKIIALTREMQGTYAVYFWNKITPKNHKPFEEWSAEFHSGYLHRVETPKVRVIANCKAKTGTYFILETGEYFSGSEVAKSACGINANPQILSARILGNKTTPFGKAIAIEIIDPSERRTYDISPQGILLGATIAEIGESGHMLLINKATHLSWVVPTGDNFSKRSLSRSVVAEHFRQPIVRKASGH